MNNYSVLEFANSLKEGEELILSCANRVKSISQKDIVTVLHGNDIYVKNRYILDCTYIECMTIKEK